MVLYTKSVLGSGPNETEVIWANSLGCGLQALEGKVQSRAQSVIQNWYRPVDYPIQVLSEGDNRSRTCSKKFPYCPLLTGIGGISTLGAITCTLKGISLHELRFDMKEQECSFKTEAWNNTGLSRGEF